MNGKEVAERWEAEKARMMVGLTALSSGEKRKLVQEASEYRSGEDSCNSVYMGGMAHARLRMELGGGMGDKLTDLLDAATDARLDKALGVCASYIKSMWERPVKKCPCCGQIVADDAGGQP